MTFGRWAPTRRKSARARIPAHCFLDSKNRRYPFCKRRKGRWVPVCEGTLAARRRAITQRDHEMEVRAIRRGRLLGCKWSRYSTARRGRGRLRRAA